MRSTGPVDQLPGRDVSQRLVRRLLGRWGSRAPEPTEDPSALRPLMPGDRPERTALVTALGVDAETLPGIVSATGRRLRRFDRVIYLTTHADFRPFRERGAIVEYMPPVGDMRTYAPDLAWPSYLEAKRRLVLVKWRPGVEIAYGWSWAEYVDRAGGGKIEAHQ